MARHEGIIKPKGVIGEYSFYDSVYGPIMRRKGGASRERIQTDPNFEQVRENNTEFGLCSAAVKRIRLAMKPFTHDIKDHTAGGRLMKLMLMVKDNDPESEKGKRCVDKGLIIPEGRTLLKGFNFNCHCILNQLLCKPVFVDPVNDHIVINDLITATDIRFPKGASNVRLKGGWCELDFTKEVLILHESEPLVLKPANEKKDLVLKFDEAPTGPGFKMYVLRIDFFQEAQGTQYDLNNNKYLALEVIDVK